MITKKDYCMWLVKSHLKELGNESIEMDKDIPNETLVELKSQIYSSSKLAVGLEYLLDLKNTDPSAYEYTNSRGGICVTCVNRDNKENPVSILSCREILDMLPESLST